MTKLIRALRPVLLIAAIAALAACPLPFEFSPASSAGGSEGSNDPSNPDFSAQPTLVVTALTGGELLNTVTPDVDVAVGFESETRSAVIYYTTDGSTPAPGQTGTFTFSNSSPIELRGHSNTVTVRAIAIGPNMYPSLLMTETVTIQYETVANPVFSLTSGTFFSDQTLSLTSATDGASIYYTMVDGSGPAPTPVPGAGGTFLYSVPITIDRTKTIRAIATKSEVIDSAEVEHTFTMQVSPPTGTPAPGVYLTPIAVAVQSSTPGSMVAVEVNTGLTPTPLPSDPTSYSTGSLVSTTEIRVIAHRDGWQPSGESIFDYFVVDGDEYDSWTQESLAAVEPSMTTIPIDNSDGNRIPIGAVVAYRTNQGRFGKMVIADNDMANNYNHGLIFDYVTYNADGTVFASGIDSIVSGTWGFNLDVSDGVQGPSDDFRLDNQTATVRTFAPIGGVFWQTGVDPTP